MAEYKGIKGFKVQSLASDPTLVEGQVWYNTTGNALKYQATATSWSSGAALGTGSYYGAGAGTLTAGLAISGASGPGPPAMIATTQEYDGTTWANGGDVSAPRINTGSGGSQTSALLVGGTAVPGITNVTEEYNGSSWTAGGNISGGNRRAVECSNGTTQDAVFIAGGKGPAPPYAPVALTEIYNGSSWTESGDLNTARASAGGAGTTTAGLAFGGIGDGPSLTAGVAVTEEWNGSSWANSNDLNTSRREMGASGTQTAGFAFGGIGPPSNQKKAVSETYDGTSWTNAADLATARLGGTASKIGTTTAAFYAGGDTGATPVAGSNITEEFGPANVIKTVTVS